MNRVHSLISCLAFVACARGETLWIEAEKPTKTNVVRHPWYSDVRRQLLSGGEFISHWDGKKAGEVEYVVQIAKEGSYDFWVRANPTGTSLSYQLGDGSLTAIDLTKDKFDVVNIAPKNALDIRFLAWVKVGKLALKKGDLRLRFRMDYQSCRNVTRCCRPRTECLPPP